MGIINWNEEMRTKNAQVYLCYMNSIWVPTCDAETWRLTLDWQGWVIPPPPTIGGNPISDQSSLQVFLFDDQFDEGHLRDNPVAAQEEVNATMAVMTEDPPLIKPN
ncbi:hypothetical protein RRF57_011213 [Xylaria bambusicola]|uniref:Uncharacterized protein n=1 Tax=Xylaria bambusicola TaxID=326684 RepID=A0AAN7UZ57_9PEZI